MFRLNFRAGARQWDLVCRTRCASRLSLRSLSSTASGSISGTNGTVSLELHQQMMSVMQKNATLLEDKIQMQKELHAAKQEKLQYRLDNFQGIFNARAMAEACLSEIHRDLRKLAGNPNFTETCSWIFGSKNGVPNCPNFHKLVVEFADANTDRNLSVQSIEEAGKKLYNTMSTGMITRYVPYGSENKINAEALGGALASTAALAALAKCMGRDPAWYDNSLPLKTLVVPQPSITKRCS